MNIDSLVSSNVKNSLFLIMFVVALSACQQKPGESDWIELSYENCITMESDSDHPHHKDAIAKAGCPAVIFDMETNATVK